MHQQAMDPTSVLRSVARLAPLRLRESSRPVAADTDTSMTPAAGVYVSIRVPHKHRRQSWTEVHKAQRTHRSTAAPAAGSLSCCPPALCR